MDTNAYMEVVLFNKEGKEIDWYDPVVNEPTIENDELVINNDFGEYRVKLSDFERYEHRIKLNRD